MATYFPLNIEVPIKASLSDLVDFKWRNDGIDADFVIPDDEAHILRVSFNRACIVRLVDEMPLSTEYEDGPDKGSIAEHFAYKVEGAVFDRTQSESWKAAVGLTSHYRFITGWTCLDVLSSATPVFRKILCSTPV